MQIKKIKIVKNDLNESLNYFMCLEEKDRLKLKWGVASDEGRKLKEGEVIGIKRKDVLRRWNKQTGLYDWNLIKISKETGHGGSQL